MTHFEGEEEMVEEKEKIVLAPNKRVRKIGFRIVSGGIRTDGKYYEAVLFLKTTFHRREGSAWAVRLIANDLVERQTNNYTNP